MSRNEYVQIGSCLRKRNRDGDLIRIEGYAKLTIIDDRYVTITCDKDAIVMSMDLGYAITDDDYADIHDMIEHGFYKEIYFGIADYDIFKMAAINYFHKLKIRQHMETI